MTVPTAEEITRAHAGITADGSMAPTTIALSLLATQNPHLRQWVNRSADKLLGGTLDKSQSSAILVGALAAAVVYGLNIGMRISDEREAEAVARWRKAYTETK